MTFDDLYEKLRPELREVIWRCPDSIPIGLLACDEERLITKLYDDGVLLDLLTMGSYDFEGVMHSHIWTIHRDKYAWLKARYSPYLTI